MSGNSFGKLFSVTTFGESHGKAIGCIVDGCPPGYKVSEKDIQPDKFGSIPQSMWWSIVTLTTVGYGDVYPLTSMGKFFGSIIIILGIGTVALPSGILASAFTGESKGDDNPLVQAENNQKDTQSKNT